MPELDSLQRFLFAQSSVRGEIVRLEQTYQTILNQRDYPPVVKHLLGEALMSAALLASCIQFEGSFSLQFHGDQRLPLLLVQCDHQLHLRALVKYDASADDIDYNCAFLAGNMTLFIDQYNKTTAYQSSVPIRSLSMADNLTYYFAQSDQIATRVWFATNPHQVAGMLLQRMPETQDIANAFERDACWEHAVTLADTITAHEMLALDNQTLLQRLFHETELIVYPPRLLAFRCQCTVDKMKQVLMVLGKQDVDQLLKQNQVVDIHCEFCNQQYAFNALDVDAMFNSSVAPDVWVKKIQ